MTLATGQKIRVPFKLMLIVATNLAASADPAFLRRIGYRIHMDRPDEQRYAEIFKAYAKSVGLECFDSLITYLIGRYQAERRELRACEPRDLIERCRDICKLQKQPARMDRELLDAAWRGYFG
jgi:SpoVK/Ycf46/Vps4 family AAA+-type ATPase